MNRQAVPLGALAILTMVTWTSRVEAEKSTPPFEDCGVLIQGVECVLFDSDHFGLYLLDNYDGFGVGDQVHVMGELDPGCISFCQQGDGCIRNNTITDCVTSTERVSWGRIKSVYR